MVKNDFREALLSGTILSTLPHPPSSPKSKRKRPRLIVQVDVDKLDVDWNDPASAERAEKMIKELEWRLQETAEEVLIDHDYEDFDLLAWEVMSART